MYPQHNDKTTNNYRSGEGWEHVQHISITKDLSNDITYFLKQKDPTEVSYIRALSFSYPQKATMEDFANSWRMKVVEAGGNIENGGWGMVPTDANANDEEVASNVIVVGDEYEFDDDDEDMDEK